MLKEKKLDYQKTLEEYLEENKVYDIFEDMMKDLIVNRPKDPIEFLINKMTSPESKYILLINIMLII
jgi:adenylate kinase